MPDACGWTEVSPATSAWSPLPRAIVQEAGGFLELEDCGLILLEDA